MAVGTRARPADGPCTKPATSWARAVGFALLHPPARERHPPPRRYLVQPARFCPFSACPASGGLGAAVSSCVLDSPAFECPARGHPSRLRGPSSAQISQVLSRHLRPSLRPVGRPGRKPRRHQVAPLKPIFTITTHTPPFPGPTWRQTRMPPGRPSRGDFYHHYSHDLNLCTHRRLHPAGLPVGSFCFHID